MPSTTLSYLNSLNDKFYAFCLDYFDDTPDEKYVIIKLPLPALIQKYEHLVALFKQATEVSLIFLLRLFLVRKAATTDVEIMYSVSNHENRNVQENENTPASTECRNILAPAAPKPTFIRIKLTFRKFSYKSFRRIIFAYRYT